MSPAPEPPSLPTPTRARWQPLRLGLVELYHYDVEEFWFRDGHLLLRGNNGTGKSKVLALTLPFLLDANLSASRVEPDGDRGKRMEWNLLMGRRYERRVGYTWLEFGRQDESGELRYFTLGCGLRAVAGRAGTDAWYFVTEQRIGETLWLTTPERTALTRDRLTEAIGARGQVFDTAQSYRRAVDERLFGLGTDRYAALVDTLIQLRQPQLSRQPDEERLSDALTEALPPLDRAALEDVAEALNELDDLRRDVDEVEAMRTAVAEFDRRYRRYAQIAARRRSRALRHAQTEFDTASRDANAGERELETARADVARGQEEIATLEERLAADGARLAALRADPLMREAARIDEARRYADKCREAQRDSAAHAQAAELAAGADAEALARRRALAETALEERDTAAEECSRVAVDTGLGADATDAIASARRYDDAASTEAESRALAELERRLRGAQTRRREQIAVVRRRRDELERAVRECERADDERRVRADAFDAATAAAERAARAWRDARVEAVAAWRQHAGRLAALRIAGVDELLEEFEGWLETRGTAHPLRTALDAAHAALEREAAERIAELRARLHTIDGERDALATERALLDSGLHAAPPAPYTRDPEVRARSCGAPLWQLVDFRDGVAADARRGLEAALETSGLLDAWVTTAGVLEHAHTHDVILRPGTARESGGTLADWLVPSVEPRVATDVPPAHVEHLLRSIACGDTPPDDAGAGAWVSTDGRFASGPLRGAWSKPTVAYVGHAAREAARHARLAEIATRVAELEGARAETVATIAALEERRALGTVERDSAPADERWLAAEADSMTAERLRREAQSAFGSAEARAATAAHARDRAADALAFDARDLSLPQEAPALAALDHAVAEFGRLAERFAAAVRRHVRARADLHEAEQRAAASTAAREAAEQDRHAKNVTLRAAEETLAALSSAVGRDVDALLADIATCEAQQARDDRAVKDSRARQILLASRRSAAEQRLENLRERLRERIEARARCIEELRGFAAAGFVAIAVPDEPCPDPQTTWGVEAALGLARRAEQALQDVDAEDAPWERAQREIGGQLQTLQTAMSAQGHAATVEPSDHGLIVRIVHRQRPERPDELERRLAVQVDEQRRILSTQERAVLENHLEKEIAANLQRMISETEARVHAINAELQRRPTSTGVRFRLDWRVLPDDHPDAVPGLAEARRRLLRKASDAWSPDERHQVGEFLQARIAAERARDEPGTLLEGLARALDYRRWHRFAVERQQDREWRPLAGPASGGERALGLTVPLFAAASSHYGSARANAPRLVLLDEAFAGIDDEARANCMALVREFDLDFVMTSEREWGCYAELPGNSICQLVRREGIDAVQVTRWTWDGRRRERTPDPERRFPGADTP